MVISLNQKVLDFFKNKDNYKKVLNYCTSLAHDLQSAEDATQEAFLKLVQKTEGGQDDFKFPEDASEFRGYVMQTARNCYLQSIRGEKKYPSAPDGSLNGLSIENQHIKNFSAIQKLDRLNDLILENKNSFSTPQLQLWECMYQCKSVEEIMIITGNKRQTIYSLRNKLKEKIRSLFSIDMLMS